MTLNLLAFAVEIIEFIADALNHRDLCSLRLVCKALNQRTLHSFGNSCSTVRTDLSRKSVQKLQDLSENALMRRRVQSLVVKSSSTCRDKWFDDPEEELALKGNPSKYLETPLSTTWMLRDILAARLVNCRSFRIRGPGETYDSSTAAYVTPSDVVGIILAIIAKDSLAVKSFCIDLGLDEGRSVLNAARIGMPLRKQPGFRLGWAHLEELLFEYSMQERESDWALDLILRAPELQKLSLNCYGCFPLIRRLTNEVRPPRLRYLKLVHATFTLGQISNVLMNCHDSLRELNLRFVRLGYGSNWVTVFRDLKDDFPLLDSISLFWITEETTTRYPNYVFFPTLSDNPMVPGTAVKRAPSSDCRLVGPLKLPVRLTYKKKSWCADVGVVGVHYEGPHMTSMLEALIESAISFGPSDHVNGILPLEF